MNTNVVNGEDLVKHEPFKSDINATTWMATHPCAVLLVKVGTKYFLYLDVMTNDLIDPFNDFSVLEMAMNISHVSCFDCAES